jgi:regulator of cell morphogenesis and NO signaling
MEHEHATAGQALADMRRLTNNYAVPDDACNTFRVLYGQLEELESDLHLHVHLENNILFPRAAALDRSIQG